MSSVTLVHPAKAVGRNEIPFGRDTRVCPINIVLDSGLSAPGEGEIWRPNTVGSDANYCQNTVMVVIII